MKTIIKNKINNNSLIITSKFPFKHKYQEEMIRSNNINCLLKIITQQINDETQYIYDITSYTNFVNKYKDILIDKNDILKFLKNYLNALEEIDEYLLDRSCISLNPEFIFIKNNEIKFCYIPFLEENFENSFKNFLQWLLENINYENTQSIKLAYEINSKFARNGFDINYLREIITKNDNIEKERINRQILSEKYFNELNYNNKKPIILEHVKEKEKSYKINNSNNTKEILKHNKNNNKIFPKILIALSCLGAFVIFILNLNTEYKIQYITFATISILICLHTYEKIKNLLNKLKNFINNIKKEWIIEKTKTIE